MKNQRKLAVLAIIVVVIGLLTASLASAASLDDLDCEALANSPLREPEGYAEQCLGDVVSSPAVVNAFDPTDTAYVYEMRNRLEIVTHLLNNFPAQTQIAPSANTYFGMDFDETGTILYAHRFVDPGTDEFGTLNTTTGAFTAIGPSEQGGTVTGLAIDPVTGEAYIVVSATGNSSLYSMNLATGVATLIGMISADIIIDLSINCEGAMYAHNITADTIMTVNRATGTGTTVGPTGLLANFAQGMDFDNADGTLYIYAYTGGGTNTYGTVNLATGAITPLAQDNPLGEYEGATQTVCPSQGAPAVAVSKSPATQTIVTGGNANFTITVTNTGDVNLANVTVSDALVPACDSNIGALAPGATNTYACTDAGVPASYTNVVTVTTQLDTGAPGPSASASAEVNVVPPTSVSLSGFEGSSTFSPVWLVAILAGILAIGFVVRRKLTA